MATTTTTSRAVDAVLMGLEGYRFLNLITFRKSGVPVLTTVLFALMGDKIYVWTPKDSGKVKRIRNDASVQIAPSTRLGRPLSPIAPATARILSVTEQREAQTATEREFGWLKKVFGLIWRLQGREQVYLEIRRPSSGLGDRRAAQRTRRALGGNPRSRPRKEEDDGRTADTAIRTRPSYLPESHPFGKGGSYG